MTAPVIDNPIVAPFDEQWLLAEDLALKTLMSGMTVSDGNKPTRPVASYYSMPDPELRAQSYPYVTQDLIDTSENRPQVQSHYGCIASDSYLMSGTAASPGWAPSELYGLSPMLLTYQVTSWSRHPRHDRAIMAQVSQSRLHPRFAQVNVTWTDPNLKVTYNNLRRVIFLSFAKRDTTVEDKRLFRNVWTIQIPSEIFYDEITLTQRAASVSINSSAITPQPPATVCTPILYPGSN